MKKTRRTFPILLLLILSYNLSAQKAALSALLSDSSMMHGSISFYAADTRTGDVIIENNSSGSLIPASIMKLVTSAAAIEMLGPDYTFKTSVGYTGTLNRNTGRLTGDIIIKGGGDPAFLSKRFEDHYKDLLSDWIGEIRKAGITKVEGRVITDDSRYDFQPVPPKWLWEDAGNYYGAGAYGLSLFDNTYEIHLNGSPGSNRPVISDVVPSECRSELSNWLISDGTSDKGYVFAAPYSKEGWLAGTVPADLNGFYLEASVSDPPLLFASILNSMLEKNGISVDGQPSTVRLMKTGSVSSYVTLADAVSPPLYEIIEALNHESINLYAEHLLKELGKKFRDNGSTASGLEVVTEFLLKAGIDMSGMFIEDGSGLSPLNSVNAREMTALLIYMRENGRYFREYFSSLPAAGKEGTLKSYFKDQVFESRLNAKSGSMTRVRSYAGYITTSSGKNIAFSVIINNYTGPSKHIISSIESILKEIILYN
jgi:serine-type D-Ala-D-Ala carboxypeptidase/endopeptidase (penicillin-binding protein 4)